MPLLRDLPDIFECMDDGVSPNGALFDAVSAMLTLPDFFEEDAKPASCVAVVVIVVVVRR